MDTRNFKTVGGGIEYTRPEIIDVNLSVEGGFCLSSQLKDFEENRIYTEEI